MAGERRLPQVGEGVLADFPILPKSETSASEWLLLQRGDTEQVGQAVERERIDDVGHNHRHALRDCDAVTDGFEQRGFYSILLLKIGEG